MSGHTLTVELGDASFDEALRYFITLKLMGGDGHATPMERTEVSPMPTVAPAFNKRAFTFPLPPDAEPDKWSLQLSAIAAVDTDESAPAVTDESGSSVPKNLHAVGEANLQLGGTADQGLFAPNDGVLGGEVVVPVVVQRLCRLSDDGLWPHDQVEEPDRARDRARDDAPRVLRGGTGGVL